MRVTRAIGCGALWVSVWGLLGACGGGRDRLLADLQSPRPEERAAAVKKLAQRAEADDLVLFTQAAKDPSSIVRGEAVAALGLSQDPRVVDLLAELLGDPDELVQGKAAVALAEIRSEKAQAYLTSQYARRGRGTRKAIVTALEAAKVPDAMSQVVAAEARELWDRNLKALNEGSLAERVGAAEELGRSGRPEAIEKLTPLLKDSQVMLAAAAARGLANAGHQGATKALTGLLSENFPELREAACEALQRLGDVTALPKLVEVATERSRVSPQATAAILALPASEESRLALCEVALNGAFGEAVAAGRELRKRGGCPLDKLAEKLRQPQTAGFALQALIGLGPKAEELAPKVQPLLAGTDRQQKRLALEALAQLGNRSVLPAVSKVYEEELKTLKARRADWIEAPMPRQYAPGFDPSAPPPPGSLESGDLARQQELFQRVARLNQQRAAQQGKRLPQVVPPTELVDDARDEQLRVLAAALEVMGALRAEGAVALFKGHLADESPSIRGAALAGLARFGGEGLPLAREGLFDAEPEVRAKVAEALVGQGLEGQGVVLQALTTVSGSRAQLLEELSRAGAKTATASDTLAGLVKDGGPEAPIAARMLGEAKSPGSLEVLLKHLEEPNAVARKEVLLALGRIGDPKARPAVARELFSERPEVRAAAVEALAAIGAGEHQAQVQALRGDYYLRVRQAVEAGTGTKQPAGGKALSNN